MLMIYSRPGRPDLVEDGARRVGRLVLRRLRLFTDESGRCGQPRGVQAY